MASLGLGVRRETSSRALVSGQGEQEEDEKRHPVWPTACSTVTRGNRVTSPLLMSGQSWSPFLTLLLTLHVIIQTG